MSAPRLFLGGVPVDRVTAAAALDRIEGLIAARAGGAVFTPNVDHVVLAARDGALAAAYRRVELSLADGMRALRLKLYDEDHKRMVTFAQAREGSGAGPHAPPRD